MRHTRIVVKKRTVILIALVTLALGLIGTYFSTFYEQNEFISSTRTFKVSYGFPFAWHGYSQTYPLTDGDGLGPPPFFAPKIYWFSLGLLLLDAASWFTISFFVSVAIMQPLKLLLKAMASNEVVMYFSSSLTFLVAGLSSFWFSQTFEGTSPFVPHPYVDLGLRLCAIGLFLVVATFYRSLIGERRAPQKSKIALTEF